jgi:aminoglycoside phosphotransferase (APT) family kinase protein
VTTSEGGWVDASVLPLDKTTATKALEEACNTVGLDPTNATLIRLGTNAVFRLSSGPVIARVARAPGRPLIAEREVAVARWLDLAGVPAVHAVDVPQPVEVDGRAVTFWDAVADRTEFGSTADLAGLLRQLHAQQQPPLNLPRLDPLHRAAARIDRLTSIAASDRDFLRARCERLAPPLGALTYVLPNGVIHGDANVGNVLRKVDGRALLADLDGFAVGAREWDLVLTAMYYDSYGWHTREEYEVFATRYGYDLLSWPGYPVLRDVRELLMVTWLAQNAESNAEVVPELRKRLHALRTDADRRDWQPC